MGFRISAIFCTAMSINGKHWYRYKYLSSEEWLCVRLGVMEKQDRRCFVCNYQSENNDVHHIWYGTESEKITTEQLFVLCRRCHNKIHGYLKPFAAKTEQEKQMAALAFDSAVRILKNQIPKHLGIIKSKRLCNICKTQSDDISKINDHIGIKEAGAKRICGGCMLVLDQVRHTSTFSSEKDAAREIYEAVRLLKSGLAPEEIEFQLRRDRARFCRVRVVGGNHIS